MEQDGKGLMLLVFWTTLGLDVSLQLLDLSRCCDADL